MLSAQGDPVILYLFKQLFNTKSISQICDYFYMIQK